MACCWCQRLTDCSTVASSRLTKDSEFESVQRFRCHISDISASIPTHGCGYENSMICSHSLDGTNCTYSSLDINRFSYEEHPLAVEAALSSIRDASNAHIKRSMLDKPTLAWHHRLMKKMRIQSSI
jgi:hypothetical protein